MSNLEKALYFLTAAGVILAIAVVVKHRAARGFLLIAGVTLFIVAGNLAVSAGIFRPSPTDPNPGQGSLGVSPSAGPTEGQLGVASSTPKPPAVRPTTNAGGGGSGGSGGQPNQNPPPPPRTTSKPPPPPPPRVEVLLGGFGGDRDLNAYCKSRDYFEAYVDWNAGAYNNWICRGNGKPDAQVNFLSACRWAYAQFDVTRADPSDPNGPGSWQCYGYK